MYSEYPRTEEQTTKSLSLALKVMIRAKVSKVRVHKLLARITILALCQASFRLTGAFPRH